MAIVFHSLTSNACATVKAIALASWQATYRDIIEDATIRNYIETYYPVEHLQSLIEPAARGQIFFETASEDDQILGFCHIGVREGEGQLFRIYLLPEAQGRGLGSALLERGEGWLRRHNISTYGCIVHPANTAALQFYQKRGFVHTPEHDVEDGLRYVKTL